jgi:hypothetical protein
MTRSRVVVSVLIAFALGMILPERVRSQAPEEILHDRTPRTLEAGRVYWKPEAMEHNVRNVTDRMARAVVVHLDPAPSR